MEQDVTKEDRLSKRLWLITRFEHILRESVYYRTHKENFSRVSKKLWHWGEEESRTKLDYVDQA